MDIVPCQSLSLSLSKCGEPTAEDGLGWAQALNRHVPACTVPLQPLAEATCTIPANSMHVVTRQHVLLALNIFVSFTSFLTLSANKTPPPGFPSILFI